MTDCEVSDVVVNNNDSENNAFIVGKIRDAERDLVIRTWLGKLMNRIVVASFIGFIIYRICILFNK
jgi:hypothetical protein